MNILREQKTSFSEFSS